MCLYVIHYTIYMLHILYIHSIVHIYIYIFMYDMPYSILYYMSYIITCIYIVPYVLYIVYYILFIICSIYTVKYSNYIQTPWYDVSVWPHVCLHLILGQYHFPHHSEKEHPHISPYDKVRWIDPLPWHTKSMPSAATLSMQEESQSQVLRIMTVMIWFIVHCVRLADVRKYRGETRDMLTKINPHPNPTWASPRFGLRLGGSHTGHRSTRETIGPEGKKKTTGGLLALVASVGLP